MTITTKLNPCICGAKPRLRSTQVAEDAEEAWVECPRCGRATERCEDAYADFETTIWLWQEMTRQ